MSENSTTPSNLSNLSIKGFRGIQNLDIPKLGQVTLIAGKNDVGKTTVLEAAQLYSSRGSESVLYSLLRRHEETSVVSDEDDNKAIVYNLRSLFYDRNTARHPEIKIGPCNEQNQDTLEISVNVIDGQDSNIFEIYNISSSMSELANLKILSGNNEHNIPFNTTLGTSLPRPKNTRQYRSIADTNFQIFGPGLLNNHQLADYWDKAEIMGTEDQATFGLNLALADKVSRVTMIGDDQHRAFGRKAHAKYQDGRSSVPLRSFGDGAVRIYGLSLALACKQNGILLIDEVENGIHHSVFEKFWSMVLQMAHNNGVQVLATTHSFDCVTGFARAAEKFEEIETHLARLERRKNNTHAIMYSKPELEIVATQGIEVR